MARKAAKEATRPVRIVDVEDYLNDAPAETAVSNDTEPTIEHTPVDAEAEVEPTGIYTLIRYDVSKDDIRAKGKEYSALTFDTPANYEQGRKAIAILRETRVAIEARRKELKQESLEYGRRVDSVAKELTSLIEEIEEPLKSKKKIVDDEKARIKAEKEAEERRQVEEQLRVEREAEEARLKAEREAEEARLKAEREAEEARLRAIREAEEARLAEERARLEAERAELQRQRDEAELAARAERERIEAAENAERERMARERAELEAERRALSEARERAEREEFERLARIRAEEEAKERAERERVAAEEARLAEAERHAAHQRRLEALRPDAEKLHEFAKRIRALEAPELATDEAREELQNAWRCVLQGVEILQDFGS